MEPGGDPPALWLAWAEIQFAAGRADALAHPGQPAAGGAGFRGAAGAVVSTSTRTSAGVSRSQTAALAPGPACFIVFVRASCTSRKTANWTPGGGSVPVLMPVRS